MSSLKEVRVTVSFDPEIKIGVLLHLERDSVEERNESGKSLQFGLVRKKFISICSMSYVKLTIKIRTEVE